MPSPTRATAAGAKGKKGSGKSLKQRKAEAARKAEEDRIRAELEEQERLERERREHLAAERRAKEEELQRQQEEAARRTSEASQLSLLLQTRAALLQDLEHGLFEKAFWQKYIACRRQPDASSEAAVNTFARVWEETPVVTLAGLAQDCVAAVELAVDVDIQLARSSDRQDAERCASLGASQATLYSRLPDRVDQFTTFVLQRADAFSNAKNECQLSVATPLFEFGLWANIQKTARTKSVDFPDLKFTMEFPKSFIHLNIAIRYMYSAINTLGSCVGRLLPVGGIMYLELLQLPPAPKHVKTWTVRPVVSNSVVRVPYPAVPGDATAIQVTAVPLHVSVHVPDTCVVADAHTPRVAWWSEQTRTWCEDDVTDVRYDSSTRALSFLTLHLTSLAVVQDRLSLFPLRSWMVYPIGRNSAVFVISTSQMDVKIRISEEGCVLLDHVTTATAVPVSPGVLLKKMTTLGLNLVPGDDLTEVPDATLKDTSLETDLCTDISLCCAAFAVSSSRWNRTLPPRRSCFLIKEHFDDIQETVTRASGAWQTVLYELADIVAPVVVPPPVVSSAPSPVPVSNADGGEQPSAAVAEQGEQLVAAVPPPLVVNLDPTGSGVLRTCSLVQASESAELFDQTICADTARHDSLYACLKAYAPQGVVDALHQASPLFTEQVRTLLRLLRLLCVS
eukprot:TRINITY_DN977_c0_g1_i1.p1 TRINITY_DN977_c0_g1~~TRINITY_DN977_c0_g1_i1.p1  ORF type:complete len:678 (-),score=138.77 TRINITY_DN977_c0_g1_i1:1937-3970(-)